MEKKCEICGNIFKIKPSHYRLRRTCSRNIHRKKLEDGRKKNIFQGNSIGN